MSETEGDAKSSMIKGKSGIGLRIEHRIVVGGGGLVDVSVGQTTDKSSEDESLGGSEVSEEV